MSVSCGRGISQEVRKTNLLSQSELLSLSVSVVTSQAEAGRVPAMAPDQQTFCWQQGGSGLGQGGSGQVTSFFLLPGMSTAGGGGRQDGNMSETAL